MPGVGWFFHEGGGGGTKSLEIKKVGRKGENGSLEEKKEEEKWFFFKSVWRPPRCAICPLKKEQQPIARVFVFFLFCSFFFFWIFGWFARHLTRPERTRSIDEGTWLWRCCHFVHRCHLFLSLSLFCVSCCCRRRNVVVTAWTSRSMLPWIAPQWHPLAKEPIPESTAANRINPSRPYDVI